MEMEKEMQKVPSEMEMEMEMEKEMQKVSEEAEAEAAPSDVLLVYVDTSLDTRLVALASPQDTAASFKGKLETQHLLTFPECGVTHVQALLVRREGLAFRLADSLPLALLSDKTDGAYSYGDCFLQALVEADQRTTPAPVPVIGAVPLPPTHKYQQPGTGTGSESVQTADQVIKINESSGSGSPNLQNGVPHQVAACRPTQTDLDILECHFAGLCKNVAEKPSNTLSEMVD